MYLFVLNAIIILCCWYFTEKHIEDAEKKKLWCISLTMGYLTFLAIFRSFEVGTDTARYCRIFEKIAQQDSILSYMFKINMEKGYVLYCYLLSKISSSPRILIVVSNLFMFYSTGRFILKNSKVPGLSVYMFYTIMLFDFFLSGLRQGMAIAILLFAYEALKENRTNRFVCLVLLATIFHLSACVFVLVLVPYKIRSLKKYMILLYGGAAVTFVMWSICLKILLVFFPKYSYYLGDSAFSAGGRMGVIYKAALYIVVLLAGWILKNEKPSENSEKDGLERQMTLILPAIAMIAFNAAGFSRFFRYFELFACVYFPNAMMEKRKNEKYYSFLFCIVGMFFYALIIHLLRTPEWQQTYPYKFFWQ